MAILPQKHLFCWEDVDDLGDWVRLRLVLEYLPDEPLAGIVFGHETNESLRRELKRNGP